MVILIVSEINKCYSCSGITRIAPTQNTCIPLYNHILMYVSVYIISINFSTRSRTDVIEKIDFPHSCAVDAFEVVCRYKY